MQEEEEEEKKTVARPQIDGVARTRHKMNFSYIGAHTVQTVNRAAYAAHKESITISLAIY